MAGNRIVLEITLVNHCIKMPHYIRTLLHYVSTGWSCRLILFLLLGNPAWANIPGGGTGTGPAVTLVNNGNGTWTMANGIVAIVCYTNSATITQINYTYKNSSTTVTNYLLAGGYDGGQLYWTTATGGFVYGTNQNNFTTTAFTVVANPANNGGTYAEISMLSASVTNGTMEVHFSMLKGSTGFYVTPIWNHRSGDGPQGLGVTRDNIYAGSQFNWMSVDAARNRLMEVSGGLSIGVLNAPVECYLWTNGIYAGQYEDKYKYCADFGVQRVWGWSSVGAGGSNVGLWNVSASAEYYDGGPMKRELMSHIGTTILNDLDCQHYGTGMDTSFTNGEVWTLVCGPYFIYCNNITNSITNANLAAQSLYNDALAQAAAENTAWPYSWFTNASYALASGRGTVTGTFVINDSGNPNASAAGLWVGLIQQPATSGGYYDFQQWLKPYQFWVKTDTNGNFTVPDVIAGTNYTLYAFGPGTPDTFMSQTQAGGGPPLICDLPATPFSVTVAGGATNTLGTVTWTPARVGATVFEIGYPDRSAHKFRHGDDYWVGDIGPSPAAPSPVWTKYLEYQFDFPSGPNYVVGQSRWATDWNFIQPVVPDTYGNFNSSSSTITFNLASAPANGAQASIYLGLSSDYYAAPKISVNGNNLGNVSVTGTPNNSISTNGYYPGWSDSDTSIREGNNGAFSDERITFPASQLQAGVNTINIDFRQIGVSTPPGYFADHLMYDYIRLELTGYVPPPPASVAAYAGNNCNLISWPVTPGAAAYNISRSTTSGSGYVSITNGVTGPVCGSGSNNAVYLDTNAVNNTTYYYVVQSVNPTGVSTNSPPSAGATPLSSIANSVPTAPTGISIAASGHQSVTVSWHSVSGADFYSVWRSNLMSNGGGASNILSTIILCNTNTGTSYTDTSVTDGSIYSYSVTATGAGGTSTNSAAMAARALPPAPASAPISLTGYFTSTTNITLNWTAVPGAVGYAIYRATSSGGSYTFLQTVTETTYTDYGLNPVSTYYYRVVAVNVGGVSTNATDLVNGLQAAPASLSAIATNAQVALTWSITSGATSYTILRGTNSGIMTNIVVTGYVGTTYTNAGLINGTTYYYVVTATGSGGTSGNSPEASATPTAAASGVWTADASGNWSTAANWSGGAIAYGSGNIADFSTISLTADRTVTLDSDRTISGLYFGDTSSSHNWTLAGTNTLTLGAGSNINVENQTTTISTVIAGLAGLVKNGIGNLVLSGVAETFSNGLAVNAGQLVLDFSNTNSPAADMIPSINDLTCGGGTLQVIGASGGSSQTFASTAIAVATSGQSIISAAPVSGTIPTNNLGTLTGLAGGLICFDGAAYNSGASSGTTTGGGTVPATGVFNVTANTVNGGIVSYSTAGSAAGAYATVGLYDWAGVSGGTVGTAQTGTIVGASQLAGFYTTGNTLSSSSSYGLNIDLTASATMFNNNSSTVGAYGTVRFNAASAITLTAARAFGGAVVGALLVTPNLGANNVTIAPNSGQSQYAFQCSRSSGAATGLTVWQNNPSGELIINANYVNGSNSGGTGSYAQGGPGSVLLNSTTNTYTGQTYLDGGYTVITNDANIGAVATAATVNINGGTLFGNATFALDIAGANPRPVFLSGAGGTLAASAGHALTVSGVVSGSANLNCGTGTIAGTGAGTANPTAIVGSGTVTLSGTNTFTGDLNVNHGTLAVNLNNNINNPTSGALGNTSVAREIIVNSGGTLNFTLGNALGSTLTTVGATLVINSGATVTDTANDIETLGPVQLNGGTLTGTGGSYAAFQMYDLEGTVTVGGNLPSTISGPSNASSGYHLAAPTTFNVADVTGGAGSDLIVSGLLVDQDGAGTIYGHLGAAGSLAKTGAGTMTLSGTNTYTGGTAINAGVLNVNAPEAAGSSGPLGKSGTITFGGGTLQYSVTNQFDYSARFSVAANQAVSIDTAGQNVTFATALTSGGGTLVKLGYGTLTLTGTNTYTGGTVIGGGTLMVGSSGGSATGTGSVTVQFGGTLGGSGAVGGAVTVNSGGTLAPGNPLGILTISNNLTLADGSQTQVQIQHSPLTNDAVNVSGILTEGGILIVTNSGVAAFTAGDSFKLFSAAGGYAGSFSSVSLPALNAGLSWNTAQLAVDGSLTVVSTNPPATTGVNFSGGNLVWHGTGGTPNWNYYILSSTNLALPLAQWSVSATNRFDAGGNFNCTNAASPNGPQQFYILEVQ